MGNFEDVFGAGADADEIIDGYSREYERSIRSEKANWNGVSSRFGFQEQGSTGGSSIRLSPFGLRATSFGHP